MKTSPAGHRLTAMCKVQHNMHIMHGTMACVAVNSSQVPITQRSVPMTPYLQNVSEGTLGRGSILITACPAYPIAKVSKTGGNSTMPAPSIAPCASADIAVGAGVASVPAAACMGGTVLLWTASWGWAWNQGTTCWMMVPFNS